MSGVTIVRAHRGQCDSEQCGYPGPPTYLLSDLGTKDRNKRAEHLWAAVGGGQFCCWVADHDS